MSAIDAIVSTLREQPEITIFLTLAIGFWFGGLKFGSFSLGAVTSTLIAGLLIGQLHIVVSPTVQGTFFLMFLFAVGFSVGPQFFRGLKSDGLPQVAFAILLAVVGLLSAYGMGKLLGYNPGLTAGLLAGGYTNSGTLGVATANLGQLGLSADATKQMAALTAIAYAVTYPFGTAGAAWFLASIGPKLLRIDLAAACKELEKKLGVGNAEPGVGTAYRALEARAFRLTNSPFVGKTVSELEAALGDQGCVVRQVRQEGAIIECEPNTILSQGATLAIGGHIDALLAAEGKIGPEVEDAELLSFPTEELDVVIRDRAVAGNTVQQLRSKYLAHPGSGIFLTKITRSGHELPFHPDFEVHRDDVLTLVGAKKDVEKAAKLLGYADRATSTSDMVFMGAGIVIGALLGTITVHIGGIPLSFSSSVGALVAGLVCGYLRSVHRTFGRIPAPALWVFNNVGLNGFVAVVGINAGPGLFSGLQAYGIDLFLAGIVVSMVPLIVGIYAGKYIFKFHPGILLGACAGARTTTAALGALQHEARSSVPALGYTITYAVGRIVLAVWGVVIILLMS
ncbi:MAG TPA: aspartate-alanine antiporter [Stellaceae bacterium]|nr:aspartate-alanine antiporter [Stellaceae bacterium]